MDHQDIATRLARRFLSPKTEEALRLSSAERTSNSIRDRVATGAFEGAVQELIHSSQIQDLDHSKLAEFVEEMLQGVLETTWKKLSSTISSEMDRPMTSGQKRGSKGSTYPEKVIIRKALNRKLSLVASDFTWLPEVQEMKLGKDALTKFFISSAVSAWVGRTWAKIAQANLAKAPVSIALMNTASEAAEESTDNEGPMSVGEPSWRLLKAELSNGKLVLGHEITFPVHPSEIEHQG